MREERQTGQTCRKKLEKKNSFVGKREMAQHLRALATFAESLGSDPRTHMIDSSQLSLSVAFSSP